MHNLVLLKLFERPEMNNRLVLSLSEMIILAGRLNSEECLLKNLLLKRVSSVASLGSKAESNAATVCHTVLRLRADRVTVEFRSETGHGLTERLQREFICKQTLKIIFE